MYPHGMSKMTPRRIARRMNRKLRSLRRENRVLRDQVDKRNEMVATLRKSFDGLTVHLGR